MMRFLGDMLIGWIIFTPSGKQMANKIVNKAFNTVKKNMLNNPNVKDLMSFQDIFMNGNDDDTKSKSNNGTKN
jgi:hypothetical protein